MAETETPEKGQAGPDGPRYVPSSGGGKKQGSFIQRQRKKLLVAILVAVLTGSYGGLMILSKPFELLQLAETIGRFNFSRNNDTTANRFARIYRYLKDPNSPSRQKLGIAGNRVADRATALLADQGIELVYDERGGTGTGDLLEIKQNGEVLHDLRGQPQKVGRAATKLVFQDSKINKALVEVFYKPTIRARAGHKFTFLEEAKKSGRNKSADIRTSLKERVGGSDGTAPRATVQDDDGNGQANADVDEGNAQVKSMSDRYKALIAEGRTSNQATRIVASEFSIGKKAIGAGAVLLMACTIKGYAETGEETVYQTKAVPAMVFGNIFHTAASEAMAGAVTSEGVGSLVGQLHDDEGSWNDAAAYQRATGLPVQGHRDLPEDAHPNPSGFGSLFGRVSAFLNIPGLNSVCKAVNTTGGQVILTAVSIGTALTGVGAAITAAISTGASIAFDQIYPTIVASMVGASSCAGDVTGSRVTNCMDLGLNLSANEEGRTLGGRALTQVEVAELDQVRTAGLALERSQQSWNYRLFSPRNHESLTTRLALSLPRSPSQFVATITRLPGAIIKSFASLPFIGRATAQTKFDHYGVIQYGFSLADQDDPRFQDPGNVKEYVDNNVTAEEKAAFDVCFDAEYTKMNNDPNCERTDEKFTFYRFYRLDQAVFAGIDCAADLANCPIYKPASPAPPPGAAPGAPPGGGAVTGNVQELARQILANPNVSYPLDAISPNGSTRVVLEALAAGRPAPVTCGNAPTRTTEIKPGVLQFIADYAQVTRVGVNALSDKCHSSGSSPHYRGTAVDFECNAVPFSTAQADPIAARYGGRRNSETCGGDRHWHYDF